MGFLTPPRRFEMELMDQPDVPPAMLVDNLHDLTRLNHHFCAVRVVLRHLASLVRQKPLRAPVAVLDLGTGSADIPRAIVCWARSRKLDVRVTAVDFNPVTVELARKESIEFPQITVERQNLLALPYEPNSFDFVISSQVIHHFTESDVVRVLRQVLRLARRGYVMSDLRRSHIAYACVWAATRLMNCNPLTRDDGPTSIFNAFTPREIRALAHRAGMIHCRVHRHPYFRMALVGTK